MNISEKLDNFKRKNIIKKFRKKNKVNDASIISQNCIGGVIYDNLGLEFSSPTINMFIEDENFVKLVENLEYYMKIKPKAITDCYVDPIDNNIKYPVIGIDDIKICCLHYKDCNDAIKRRKKRINYDNIVVIGNSWNMHENEKLIERLGKTKYKKIIFTYKDYHKDYCIKLPGNFWYLDERCIVRPNLTDFMPNSQYRYFEKIFDFVEFINSGYIDTYTDKIPIKEKIKKDFLWIAPKSFTHKYVYKLITGKKLNLNDPVDFNEKLHYLMVYKYGKKEALLTDKILVKKYIENKKIDGLFVPKTLKVYKNVNEIDLNELPEKFVLKCNHGSGGVEICDSKKDFNFEKAKKVLFKSLKQNYAKIMYEYHYKYIKPYIFAEEYLNDKNMKNPIDYKIYCKNGKAKTILVCSQRDSGLKLNEYDLKWNEVDLIKKEFKGDVKLPKPKKLKEMIKIAEKISKEFPFVRVDLYEIDDKIYFGELTFTPAAGFCYYYGESSLMEHAKYININDYK